MRLLQSTPQNREFFNEHGRSLRTFAAIANLGQLLSALSLSLAVFTLLSDALTGRGLSVTTGAIVAAAVLIGLFVELANRALARPAIKPFVVPDQFADDPDRQKRHRTLTRFSRAGLLIVGGLSFALSYLGSMDAGKLVTDAPPAAPVDSITTFFAADTAALLTPYRTRTAAARQLYEATAAAKEKAAQDFAGCASKGNKWCKKKQRAILAEIDAARAKMSTTIATVATERGKALTAALQRRDVAINDARTIATKEATEATAAADKNGYIFAALTGAGQLIFYLMFYLILQVTAGSEIGEELQPNEFSNQPTVIADLKAVVNHRTERGARRLIAWAFGDRDRLDKSLPYVDVWNEQPQPTPATTPPPASKREPRFYQAAEDPNTNTGRVPLNAHEQNTEHEHGTPEAWEIKQRLKLYKKRLGKHEQKAIVQRRKDGTVKTRTASAIDNNRAWVEHYTGLLNDLTNEQ